ncbi:MAG: cytochrome c [Acidobacteriia bacterium]|nr:cytochrome c [Terriglobia bacterium]
MSAFRVFVVCAAGAAAAVAGTAGQGEAAKGKQVFQANCAVCHNADSDQKKMGPGLKGLFKRDKLANGKKPTEGNVRAKIDDGGNGMPQYKDTLSDQEKDDLIAYLRTL